MSRAGIILFDDKRRVVLVQNWVENWTLPRGVIKTGEEPRDAAIRELYEETGIKDINLFEDMYTVTNRKRQASIYFFCAKTKETTTIGCVPKEILRSGFYDIEIALKMISVKEGNVLLRAFKDLTRS